MEMLECYRVVYKCIKFFLIEWCFCYGEVAKKKKTKKKNKKNGKFEPGSENAIQTYKDIVSTVLKHSAGH